MTEQTEGVEQYPSTLVHGSTTAGELVKVQTDNPEQYHAAINAVQHNTQRRLVWAVIQNDGRISYNELERFVNVTERTQRKHLSNLESDKLLQRIDANFTFVEFYSDTAKVLLHHALSTWYDRLD